MTAETLFVEFHKVMAIELYTVGETTVTLGRIVFSAITLALAFLVSYLVRRSIKRMLRRKGVSNSQTLKTTSKFTHILVMIVAIVMALKIAGLDLSTLFAAGAVLTVGLGFAMQNIAQNFVSGIILFAERSIQPDDILEVDGKVVKVLRIGIRATLALTRNREEMIIPNSNISQGTVINYTMTDASYLLTTSVGVHYSSNMQVVSETLRSAAAGMPWRVENGRVSVLMSEFGNSSVNFTVYVEVNDPWRARVLTSELNEAIWYALKDAGITIAYPQMDVHVKPS